MNVSLTPKLEKYVHSKVKTGRYTSASEVVREAIRLLEENEKEHARALREFQAELDRRIAEAEAGELLDGEKVFAQIREKSRLRRKKSA
ncbi:MAG TPA: type II toxin-antitoxin system ParD family antitoxin [Acidobacteriaceae bacterium]|nr:type II toxin-antitoxin system ParD family antitoxin [Acidobacteriaceae bacterium]